MRECGQGPLLFELHEERRVYRDREVSNTDDGRRALEIKQRVRRERLGAVCPDVDMPRRDSKNECVDSKNQVADIGTVPRP